MDDTTVKALAVFAEYIGPASNPKTTDTLIGDLGLDSLEVVEIALRMEEAFGLDISDDHIESWKTVGDVITSVSALLKEKAA
jgi:acyl carrier protein